MASKRKFYKTVIKIEVISEGKVPDFDGLGSLYYFITEGNGSGQYDTVSTKELSSKQAAKELIKQGSDPEFFGLDEKGNNVQ